jgi:hypothetical protein
VPPPRAKVSVPPQPVGAAVGHVTRKGRYGIHCGQGYCDSLPFGTLL